MAHRLLPFRQYDENDVVNLFALRCDGLQLLTTKPDVDGLNADGVLVQVENGNLNEGVINVGTQNSAFMNSYNSPVVRNPYPENPLKLKPATSGSALGVTLNQTLAIDENNEQLLFNNVKKDELQAVLSGQTVPVLTRGLITVADTAIATPTVSNEIKVGSRLAAKAGQFIEAAAGDKNPIGKVIGSGSRGGNYTAGMQADGLSGNYYLIQLNC